MSRGVAAAALRDAVRAVESRGSVAADLPPLSPEAHEAATAALRLLRTRPRSTHELGKRLEAKEFSPEAVEEALDRIEVWGLLDDADFAHEWVRGRRARRGKSAGQLRRELRGKGVAERHVEAALAGINREDDRALATGLVRDRLDRVAPEGPPGDPAERTALTRRLVAFLARRGYPESMALEVVREQLAV